MAEKELFGLFAGILILATAFLIYWVPSLIARRRNHSNLFSIALVNLFFGWTLIGWFIALIWAATDNVKAESRS